MNKKILFFIVAVVGIIGVLALFNLFNKKEILFDVIKNSEGYSSEQPLVEDSLTNGTITYMAKTGEEDHHATIPDYQVQAIIGTLKNTNVKKVNEDYPKTGVYIVTLNNEGSDLEYDLEFSFIISETNGKLYVVTSSGVYQLEERHIYTKIQDIIGEIPSE